MDKIKARQEDLTILLQMVNQQTAFHNKTKKFNPELMAVTVSHLTKIVAGLIGDITELESKQK